jgi:magnesium chelatase family protein
MQAPQWQYPKAAPEQSLILVSAVLMGVELYPVEIQVSSVKGLPNLSIIGLPDQAIREARERIKSAIENSGYQMPLKNLVINLAPAHLKKIGTQLDLPMALAILMSSGQLAPPPYEQMAALGELSLDGGIKPFRGFVPLLASLREIPGQALLLPQESRERIFEYRLPVPEHKIFWAGHLNQLDQLWQQPALLEQPLQNDSAPKSAPTPKHFALEPPESDEAFAQGLETLGCFSEVQGQEMAKRALAIAAVGGHNVLLLGPPGCGKSMLAQRFPLLLPFLTDQERLEALRIHSLFTDRVPDLLLWGIPPLRQPHHSATEINLLGGGLFPRPGEISLAHNGVLFLDEFAEFHTSTLQALREPMETGEHFLQRQGISYRFPARFQLIAASNPCRCGYLFDRHKQCTCSTATIRSYISKINGPLIDRIDIEMEMPRSEEIQLARSQGKGSRELAQEVWAARQRGKERLERLNMNKKELNAALAASGSKEILQLEDGADKLLLEVGQQKGLSYRVIKKLMSIARSIADLKGVGPVSENEVIEALQYKKISEYYQEILQ